MQVATPYLLCAVTGCLFTAECSVGERGDFKGQYNEHCQAVAI